jgi:hypothetical protein
LTFPALFPPNLPSNSPSTTSCTLSTSPNQTSFPGFDISGVSTVVRATTASSCSSKIQKGWSCLAKRGREVWTFEEIVGKFRDSRKEVRG